MSISRNSSSERIIDDIIQDVDRETQTAIMESINNINYVPNSINVNSPQSPGNNSNISTSNSYSSSSSSSSSRSSNGNPEDMVTLQNTSFGDDDNNECKVVATNRIYTKSCLQEINPITDKNDYENP